MELSKVVASLNEYCHPNLAESWDNVGLLVEPTPPHKVQKIVLTNDLSELVVEEAASLGAGLIFSYHPPIFTPLKRLNQGHWKERNVIKCLENKIAVYSPHTGLDAKEDGLNDWLLSPFKLSSKVSVTPPTFMNEDIYEVTAKYDDNFRVFSLRLPLAPIMVDIISEEGAMARFKYPKCQKEKVEEMAKSCGVQFFTKETVTRPHPMGQGAGRVGMLDKSVTISDVAAVYKKLLGVQHLKICLGLRKKMTDSVSCVAVCAGSGGALLTRQAPALLADILVTGEASHHEQLEMTSRGATVIIVGQTAVERNYLNSTVVPWMQKFFAGVEVIMSKVDKECCEIF